MFARTAASPARKGADYVCLSCRHERVLSVRQSQQRRRWNSGLSKDSTAATADADDGLLLLNDLSETYGDKPAKKSAKQERSIDELRTSLLGQQDEKEGTTEANSERKTRRQRSREAARTGRPSLSISRRPQAQDIAPARRPQDISGLLQSLQQEHDGDSKSSRLGRRTGEAKLRSGDKTVRFSAAPASGKSGSASPQSQNPKMLELMESLGPDLEADIERLGSDMDQSNEEEYDEHLKKKAAAAAVVPEPVVKSKEPVPFPSFSSGEKPSAPAPPRGFFASAMNYVKEMTGFSKPVQEENAEQSSEKRAENSQSDSKSVAKPISAAEDISDLLKRVSNPTASKTPVERLEESKNRVPWGESSSANNAPDNRVAAFEDIAAADTVSVKKPIATSFSSRPFGGEPAPHSMAALRDQLQQNLNNEDVTQAGDGQAAPSEASNVSPPTVEEASAPQPAHSRLSELYSKRDDTQTAAGEPNPDIVDTMDLAYLRRQHDREWRDVKASIRKHFSGTSLPTNTEIDRAAKLEAGNVAASRARTFQSRKAQMQVTDLSPSAATTTSDNPKSALKDVATSGMSLAAAMRPNSSAPSNAGNVPKRKVGRPRKIPVDPKPEELDDRVKSQPSEAASAADTIAASNSAVESETTSSTDELRTSTPSQLHINPLDIPQPPVPFLQYGLDRVLFNPGVYQLQDEASRVYNFDPYLQNIMPNAEFDFDSLKEYKTSSKDEALAAIAKEHGNKYIGSTSSMTSALGQFHYLLSNWRPLNYGMLSNDFVGKSGKALPEQLTQINRAPSAIFLRWKNGTYAIDADKEHDSANVLMLLGKSMELLLTLPKDEFERYRKSDPRKVSEEQRTAPESYQYTTMRDFLMRSQLDAYDPRLPGNGTFDLKTRAVVSVRHAADNHEPMTGYEIYANQGRWGSYEKEYYDMMRSTMLKYMLQARMGRMNGIFVAYHNVERMFGFQYLPIADMDRALHGQTDPTLGDQEFRASLDMMNEVFNAATKKFPEQSLRIHFEAKEAEGEDGMPTALHVFAEPVSEEEADRIQNSQKAKIAEWERKVMGKTSPAVEEAVSSADDTQNVGLSAEVVQDDAATAPEADAISPSKADDATIPVAEDGATAEARSAIEDGDAVEEDADAVDPATNKSTSNADPKFLNHLADTSSETLKPLFYATIITQSHVNDLVRERPENLKPEDEWRIDYILKEYEIGSLQWAAYEDCKSRRKMAYAKEEEEEGVAKTNDGYIAFLKKLSEKGRVLRKAKDEKEDGLPVVRVEDLDMERLDKVESVEDYMKFLEKPKEKGSREMFG